MSIHELVEELLSKLTMHAHTNRPLIVAIDGLSGAGKTTLVKEIEQNLIQLEQSVVTFHIDDFIVQRNSRYNTGFDEWYEFYYLQWDVNKLKNDLFEKLHYESKSILSLPFYDKFTDSILIQNVLIPSESIILIEGVFLQRVEWRPYYDFVLFLDCDRHIRNERVLKRDSYIGDLEQRRNKYERRYWLGEDYYMEKEQPIKSADMVIKVRGNQ